MGKPDKQAFAVWLTGRPASGKSTIAARLVALLLQRGIEPAVLESDALRRVLTPEPTYSESERDVFYGAMLHIGLLLVNHGVPVIFDATANRRRYRDAARQAIRDFVEVYIDCPVEDCARRDPKGLYAGTRKGTIKGDLPGVGADYEPPLHPEITIDARSGDADSAAAAILERLESLGFLSV